MDAISTAGSIPIGQECYIPTASPWRQNLINWILQFPGVELSTALTWEILYDHLNTGQTWSLLLLITCYFNLQWKNETRQTSFFDVAITNQQKLKSKIQCVIGEKLHSTLYIQYTRTAILLVLKYLEVRCLHWSYRSTAMVWRRLQRNLIELSMILNPTNHGANVELIRFPSLPNRTEQKLFKL